MRPLSREERRRAVLGRALVACAAIVALASTFWGLKSGLPRLNDERAYWSATPDWIRDDPVAEVFGYGDARWERLARLVGEGDRYVVIAQGEGQHEVRNYAAYRLLPAIQVRTSAEANVVLIYEVGTWPPNCLRVDKDVCIVRRAL